MIDQEDIDMKTEFKFTYKYDKLKLNWYSTIRGKSAFNQYKIGHKYKSGIKNNFHLVMVMNKIVTRIYDLPMKTLRNDIAPFKMKSRMDFIKFINKFRRSHKIKSEDEFVTIFWLKKIRS